MSELTTSAYFVKICGVTTIEDAAVVVDAGATALGVILTTSKRHVDAERARVIGRSVAGRIVRVGVIDTRDPASVDAVLAGVDVDAVQVHGDLTDHLIDELRRRDLAVIKALSTATLEFDTFDDESVDAVLVDGPVPGSGRPHSFVDLADRQFVRPVIAAGGLTPMSVGAVIDAHRVWGVDVASGVESSPGRKDPARVVEFVDAARRAFAAGVTS